MAPLVPQSRQIGCYRPFVITKQVHPEQHISCFSLLHYLYHQLPMPLREGGGQQGRHVESVPMSQRFSESNCLPPTFSLQFFQNWQGLPRWLSGRDPICQCRRPEGQGFDPLKEGIATHFSILAWEIGWTEEPSGLQSIGLQRVRHVRSDLA